MGNRHASPRYPEAKKIELRARLGEGCMRARKAQGISRKELSSRVPCTESALAKFEDGAGSSDWMLCEILYHLDIKLEEVLT